MGRVEHRLPDSILRYRQEALPRQILLHLRPAEVMAIADRLTDEAIRSRLGALTGPEAGSGRRRRDPLGLYPVVRSALRKLSSDSPVRFVDGYAADAERRRYLALVHPDLSPGDFFGTVRFAEKLESAVADYRAENRDALANRGLRVTAVGRPLLHAESYRALAGDSARNVACSAALICLLFYLTFQRVVASLLALLPIASGIAAALAAGSWANGGVHLFTLVFCVLLVGLGIDFALHIGSHYWLLPPSPERPTAMDRLIYALERPFFGISFGALTTVAAFAALGLSSYSVIRQTGALIALGVAVVLAASYLCFPAVLWGWPDRRRGAGSKVWNRCARLLSRLQRCSRSRGLAFWGILLLAAGPGIACLRYEEDPRESFVRGNRGAEELDRVTKELGFALQPVALVSEGASPEEALEKDRKAVAALRTVRSEAGIAGIESLAPLLPPAKAQRAAREAIREQGKTLDRDRFLAAYAAEIERLGLKADRYLADVYPAKVAQLLDADPDDLTVERLAATGLAERVDRHVTRVGERWYSASFLYLREYPWKRGVLDRLRTQWSKLQRSGIDGSLLTDANRGAAHRAAMRRDVRRVTLAAALAVSVLVWFQFRSLRSVLRALTPVAVGTWLLAGLMGYAGAELNAVTLAVLPILIGIGVDDGIHINQRIERGEPLETIFAEAGPGVVMTTVTTAAAFLTLVWSTFEGIRDFGLYGGLGMIFCLAASLHLLPLCAGRPSAGRTE